MNDALYGVYGAAGLGTCQIMPLARKMLQQQGLPIDRLVFVDDAPSAAEVNGYKVLRYAEFLSTPASERYAAIAISNSHIREKLAQRLIGAGVIAWTILADNILIMDDVELGEGGVLCPFVSVTSNTRVGRFFQGNIYSLVGHDCKVGDFVTFAPRVSCNGNVIIEDHAYIGTGAVIRQGKPGNPLVIGRGAVVGMGAVVTKSVPPGVTVVGNPARPMGKK